MIQIKVINVDGINKPSSPIPSDNIGVICDGETYTVYQPGDELPEILKGNDDVR